MQGSVEAGLEDARGALAGAEACDDDRVRAAAHSALAHGHGRLYENAEALVHMERGLELYRAIGDKAGIAIASMRLGVLAYERGEYQRAEELYSECLPALREMGREDRVGSVLANLSLIYRETGRLGEATAVIRESLAIAERLGQTYDQAIRSHNLGNYLGEGGHYPAALVALLKSKELLGDHPERWRPRLSLAQVYDRIGLHEEARAASEECLVHARAANARLGEGLARLAQATNLDSLDQVAQAADSYRNAIDIFEGLEAPQHAISARIGLALVLERLGDPDGALDEIGTAAAAARDFEDPSHLIAALVELGRMLDATGESQAAHVAFEEARNLAATIDQSAMEPDYYRALAEHDRLSGDFDRAFESFQRFHDEATRRAEMENEARRMIEPATADVNADAVEWQRRYKDQSDVLRSVVHDLRNALLGITGAASLGLEDVRRPDVGGKLQAISSVADRMIEILERVREPSTFDPGRTVTQRVAFNLDDLASRAVEDHTDSALAKEIALKLVPCGAPTSICADPARCREVVDNILSNAVKFTPCRGHVTITVEPSAIVVEDSGPGFTATDRQRMFQRFARLSARPTAGEAAIGLGLYVAKGLMEAMDGDVACVSNPGEPARMRISWGGAEPTCSEAPDG